MHSSTRLILLNSSSTTVVDINPEALIRGAYAPLLFSYFAVHQGMHSVLSARNLHLAFPVEPDRKFGHISWTTVVVIPSTKLTWKPAEMITYRNPALQDVTNGLSCRTLGYNSTHGIADRIAFGPKLPQGRCQLGDQKCVLIHPARGTMFLEIPAVLDLVAPADRQRQRHGQMLGKRETQAVGQSKAKIAGMD